MVRKTRQYTNPFIKPKAQLAVVPNPTISKIKVAIAFHQQGKLDQAEEICRQLLEVEPRNSDALLLLGLNAHQKGQHQAAIEMIDLAIEVNPRVASYHSIRGNALKELKQLDASVASYDKAIALKPDYPEAYSNRGIALQELKQLDASVASYDRAIALKPDYAEAYSNRGNALKELKQLNASVASYDKAIALKPDYPEAYSNRGIALQELKQLDASVASYNKAIALKPNFAEAFYNRGNALQELKQLDASVASYEKAIALKPEYAQAYCNRGTALKELKQLDASVASYDRAIALNSDFAEAFYNRGNALKELKKLDASVDSYDKSIALKPDYAEAYCNRGNALQELKQLDASVASYDKAIALKLDYAEAYSNRGTALKELKQLDAALASYNKACGLNPDIEFLLGMRQHARMFVCDWRNVSESLIAFESEITKHKPVVTPFISLVLFDKPHLHLLSSKIYVQLKYPKNKALGEVSRRADGGKVRLGYFSADLRYHPVAIWLAEQLENHDKSKFELFAFSYRSDIQDPMRARLEATFDHFIEVDKMSDLEVAQLSRKLGIDIALDLTGFTGGCRMGIFAARAAPIQVSHLGFPGSLGAEYIDYLISDVHSIPQSAQKYFSEKIAYVPCAYTYDRQRQISIEPLSRAQFGLPDKGFVFTCQNGCQKFTPEVFDIWMDILKAVPASVLWLMEPHQSAKANLTKEAQARGVQSDRLVFTKREIVPADQERDRIERYLASYALADLFLDTWPYNAGTTAVDALWAGLPVLTKAGDASVARMATSALQAIALPELIVSTAQQYYELAVRLASDPLKLKCIKHKMQENRATSALFDAVGNTRHIEKAYIKMYERYQADLPPEHLYITVIYTSDKKDLKSV